MNLEELIDTWKKQDSYINENLKIGTLHHLLKKKSQHALNKIRRILIKELTVIILVVIVFDALFFLVNIPFSTIRWTYFAVFNLTALIYITFYQKMIWESRIEFKNLLEANLKRITKSLRQFRHVYLLTNVPVVVICFLMFAGAHNLFILVPWMILEFSLLRWVMLPKLGLRFEDYKADLEYSLRQIQDIEE